MKVGIIGSTSSIDSNISKISYEIGEFLAKNNFIVVTGGVSGYPENVIEGAISKGGTTRGYIAGKNILDHSKFHKISSDKYKEIIPLNNYLNGESSYIDNYIRSLNMCNEIDFSIVIGGRVGTMYEFTILAGLGKDIYILSESGGITNNTIKKFKLEGHKRNSRIEFFNNINDLDNLLKKYK